MSNIACPYCFNEINIPSNILLVEDFKYTKKCNKCNKNFLYSAWTQVHFITEVIENDEEEKTSDAQYQLPYM